MFRVNYRSSKNMLFFTAVNIYNQIWHNMHIVQRKMLFNTTCQMLKEINSEQAQLKAEKKKKSLFITLIGTDGKLSTSTLEAATKLSKRRDLKLVKVSDLDSRKENPLYQLLSSTHTLKEDIQNKKENKESGLRTEKIISLSHKINEHDLNSKIKQITKWLEKKHEVRATISGLPDSSLAESVFQTIESKLGNNGRILQKRTKGSDIKFSIVPPKEEKTVKESEKTK